MRVLNPSPDKFRKLKGDGFRILVTIKMATAPDQTTGTTRL